MERVSKMEFLQNWMVHKNYSHNANLDECLSDWMEFYYVTIVDSNGNTKDVVLERSDCIKHKTIRTHNDHNVPPNITVLKLHVRNKYRENCRRRLLIWQLVHVHCDGQSCKGYMQGILLDTSGEIYHLQIFLTLAFRCVFRPKSKGYIFLNVPLLISWSIRCT